MRLTEEKRAEIREALHSEACQFDLETVREYQKVKNNDLRFTLFLKADRLRVEHYYQDIFNNYVDSKALKDMDNSLHPGFSKICGLKGSKLSGGQK